jgi:hypothetical protein
MLEIEEVTMVSRICKILVSGSLAMCLGFVLSCGARPTDRSDNAIPRGDNTIPRADSAIAFLDMEVRALVDGESVLTLERGAAVITLIPGKLAVYKDAVKLNGEELAKLPAQTKKVELDYTSGKLTIKADGKSILSKEIRK